MRTSFAYLIAFTCVIATSLLGSVFTNKTVNSKWYSCIKPTITPPSFIFPIVWTILYILIGIAFAKELQDANANKTTIILFTVNLLLNIVWCYFYFGQKKLSMALILLLAIIMRLAD